MGFEEEIKKLLDSRPKPQYKWQIHFEDGYKQGVEDAVAVHRLHCKKLVKVFKTRPKPSDFKGIIEDRMKEYIIAIQFWLLDVEGLLKK